MENLLSRHRNISILVFVLFAEIIGLAVQVKRSTDTQSTRLIRLWTVSAVTPVEEGLVRTEAGIRALWRGYFDLRGVRDENHALQAEIQRLRLQQVRVIEDAQQARRLQVLLGFKEQFISRTVPAQVIGSSGSDLSRMVYIDKGAQDGIRPDLAVVTADGVVGKVLRTFAGSSQVLLINDPSSGVGAILDKSRLQGVLKGSAAGETILEKVMADERVENGEKVLTSGGDQIFPKGMPIGTITRVSSGSDLFLNIRVRPAANLSRLEEVLVITRVDEREPVVDQASRPVRAIDILANRLPSVPVKSAASKADAAQKAAALPATGATKPAAVSAATPDATAVVKTPAIRKPGISAASSGALPTSGRARKTPSVRVISDISDTAAKPSAQLQPEKETGGEVQSQPTPNVEQPSGAAAKKDHAPSVVSPGEASGADGSQGGAKPNTDQKQPPNPTTGDVPH